MMDTGMTNGGLQFCCLESFFLLDNLHSDRTIHTQMVFSLFLSCSPGHWALSLKLFYLPSHLSVLCSSTWTHMRQRNCSWYQKAVPWYKPHWERNPVSERPPQGSLSHWWRTSRTGTSAPLAEGKLWLLHSVPSGLCPQWESKIILPTALGICLLAHWEGMENSPEEQLKITHNWGLCVYNGAL